MSRALFQETGAFGQRLQGKRLLQRDGGGSVYWDARDGWGVLVQRLGLIPADRIPG